jgi:hypothetical protein
MRGRISAAMIMLALLAADPEGRRHPRFHHS